MKLAISYIASIAEQNMFVPYHIERWIWIIDADNAGMFQISYNVKYLNL